MKKLIVSLAVFSFSSAAFAADFSALAGLKAADIGVKTQAAVPAVAAPEKAREQVPQDLVYRFDQVKNDLWRLNSDTTWLRSDLDRLESTARRIAQTNSSDPFFQNDLQRKAWDLNRYVSEAQRIGMSLKSLLSLAQKDQQLNNIARSIDMDANTLLNRAQFEIENSAQRLEWAVRGAKPEAIGYNAQWQAMDISRYSRDFTWKVRDISYDARALDSNTRP